ncbi:MAG: hypothetical protein KF868_13975 [Acidobacteria bacterium]|nr:hypothetical protein [Acidobacteriota bacterium]MCW5970454.1 hypothetical protein [Blastocatellales bacterium]
MSEAERLQWETQQRARMEEMFAKRLEPLAFEIGEQFAEMRRSFDSVIERERARRIDERAIFNAAVAEIDRQRTQAGILAALVDAAAQFAPRIVFFAVRGDRARGWKGRGLMDGAIAGLSLPINSTTIVGDAVEKRQSIFIELQDGVAGYENYSPVIDMEGSTPPACALAIPIVIRGKAAAALYADADTPEALDLQPLEALARVAGMTIELLPLRRSTEPLTTEAAPPRVFTSRPRVTEELSAEASATETSKPVDEITEEVAEAGEAVAETNGDAAETADEVDAAPERYAAVPDTAPLGLPAVEDIPPPPPPPPFRTEYSVPTEAKVEQAISEPQSNSPDQAHEEVHEEVQEDSPIDERLLADARRYARFLVSGIKLYHPAKVAEGLRRSDLFERLREEIERNRELYDRHVPERINARFDYFYDELVRTLAEGDASKLGRNHPYP